jgi:2-polyprenyl-3-methyl-5-hydroxy-6-metoxy-1,4-benzoquinol methylase
MLLALKNRAMALTEAMDDPACDPKKLARTYAQFARVNFLLSGWTRLYTRELRPALLGGARTVLDIGCGGGDVIRHLSRLARRDGFSPTFLGIDPDLRAIAFARAQDNPNCVSFEQTTLDALTKRFDLVLSNHVLHHVPEAEIGALCDACERVARMRVVHNDICRDDLALALFPLVGGWFRGSFIFEDGMRSVRRAFTAAELEALAPPGWRVCTSAPFRLQLIWKP